VRRTASKLAAVLVAACAWICGPAGGAQALGQIAFAPCGASNSFACGHLTVPLDPSGAVPGTITLALRRHRAPVGEARSAIIALAGGPGQPALPFTEAFTELLGPAAATRDEIVFDQRGAGLSHALSCHAFERPGLFRSLGRSIEACASQIGPTRSFYTTADTVADIEAIRQAGGYEKLVLYGTSYGTKVAEQYGQTHPGRVEALVLDSVVPPNGPDPLDRATFAAIPRILRQICSAGRCAHITADPVADMAKLLARIRRAPLRGRVIDGHGHGHEVGVSSGELVDILLAGDFSPIARAELVTASSAAVRGDSAPLARLITAAESGEGEREDVNGPLFFATSCEEEPFPWNRASAPGARLAQAAAAARALPASVFAPFTAADALEVGDLQACAHWPFATPAPAADDAPLPNVPTLILSGSGDLRTPTANASEVAAQIPDAHLLVVPGAGHSVLTDEPTPCAREALKALFSEHQILPCRAAPPSAIPRPPPLPPLRLAAVSPIRGNPGAPGRALHGVALTLSDFARQLALQLIAVLSSENAPQAFTLRTGGLRAGWAQYAGGTLSLHRYSYIPGLAISGTLKRESANLRVEGSATFAGTLRTGAHGALVGTLGGRRVRLPASSRATAAIVGVDAQARPHSGPGGTAARAAVGQLAQLLGRFQP
jgi:pimeloyl-ACP methyl ester carboxylesterase